MHATFDKPKACCDMSTIAFYFLLRVGEYSGHVKKATRRTKQFRPKNPNQGRWSSDTFLMYIHEQISAFSAGLTSKMSTEIGWHNIDGPTLTERAVAA
jgi:hypothetical protein